MSLIACLFNMGFTILNKYIFCVNPLTGCGRWERPVARRLAGGGRCHRPTKVRLVRQDYFKI